MPTPNIGETLTRKIGPLPAWGWGVAIGGSLLAVKMLRGGTSRETLIVPTGGPATPEEFGSELGEILNDIRGRVDSLEQNTNTNTSNTNKPSTPIALPFSPQSGSYVQRFLDTLRMRYGQSALNTFLSRNRRSGETAEQTTARLTSNPYNSTMAMRLLEYLRSIGGQAAANNFAAANRKAGETLAQAYLRLFGTPQTQMASPSTTG